MFCVFSVRVYYICMFFNILVLSFAHVAVFSFTVYVNEDTSCVVTFIELPFRGLQRQYNVSFQLLCSLRFALVAFQLYIFTFCKLESGYCFLLVQTSPRSSVCNPML